ncbi:MAG: FAD-dependent oxidoreductase [Bdellovibrionales bacterium]
MFNRREFIRLASLSGASIYLTNCTQTLKQAQSLLPLEPKESQWLTKNSSIDRTLSKFSSSQMTGDNFTLAHQILWDKTSYIKSLGKLPEPTEQTNVAIVGGGMSGLISAFELSEQNPVVLEQAPRFGGNSKGESWKGLDFSLGAAYFVEPEEDSPIAQFLNEVGVDKLYKLHEGGDPVLISGKKYLQVWENGTNPKNKAQFQKIYAHFLDIYNDRGVIKYPEIPSSSDSEYQHLAELDRMNFKEYVQSVLNEPLDPHLEAIIENFFWSSAGASPEEISASMAINFFASEFGALAVCPGGNAAIAEKILERLAREGHSSRLRTNCLVFHVEVKADHVLIYYVQDGKPKCLQAKKAVMSCPKFVVAKVVQDLEEDRLAAIRSLKYRSYLVANILIKPPLKDSFYDLFFMPAARFQQKDLRSRAKAQGVTDIVLANFAQRHKDQSILTLYKPLAYEGSRAELFPPNAFDQIKSQFNEQIKKDILPALNIPVRSLEGLRITRWGHPIPICEKGAFANGKIPLIRKPFRDRLFFVEQDNWLTPAFETCFEEAHYWAEKVKKS